MSSDLSDEAQQHVREYLAFLRRKREQAISEVAAEFKELKESRLLHESYSLDDVAALFDGLLATVRASMRRELTDTGHSSALLLVQTLEQLAASASAGSGGAPSLELDISRTEDGDLHRSLAQFELDAAAGGKASLQLRAHGGKPAARALPTLGGSVRDLDAAKESAAVQGEKALKLGAQLQGVLRDKSALGAELEAERAAREDAEARLAALQLTAAAAPPAQDPSAAAMADELRAKLLASTKELAAARQQLGALRESSGASGPAASAELARATEEAGALATKLAAAEAALNGRLEASTQVKSMRVMIAKKSALVKDLRERLRGAGVSTDDIEAADD